MGLFNTNIFKELENGLKNFEKNIKKNMDEGQAKPVSFKCKNCGSNIETTTAKKEVKCSYCGSLNKNEKYEGEPSIFAKQQVDYETFKLNYPVLVMLDDECGFSAFDCQTEAETNCYKTVNEALEDMKKQLEEISKDMADDGQDFEALTEQKLMQNKYAQKEISKGAKVKYIQFECAKKTNFADDPNW